MIPLDDPLPKHNPAKGIIHHPKNDPLPKMIPLSTGLKSAKNPNLVIRGEIGK